ncbi:primosomal protein N' [Carbonactinospora thermoautotrophica]|uniref:primosomal protein N' n=1 Tax=Carbonactinospora thermoautotrophica TaxID=1469144 RepID=UPI003DA86D8F
MSDQLQLIRAAVRKARPKPAVEPSAELPVARVAVDVPLAHLDRPFDYLVPEGMAEQAVSGARVRVRFAGQLVDGFILERAAESEHPGRLSPLQRVVSPEPVLAPEIAELARAVADRYAGTLADVLRLAIPPRHAAAEAEPSPEPADPPAPPEPGDWARYEAGPQYLHALAAGGAPRAVWTALPGPAVGDWPVLVALAVQATLAGGRGALVVVPDGRDVARVSAALDAAVGAGRYVALTHELGPAERYRRWLAVRRGGVRAVVGTRAAMFAPVRDLGLVVVWDDGDDLHAEPRAPYPHVREVLGLRAHLAGCAALIGGFARTAEGARLLASGWARPPAATRAEVRRAAPLVRAAGEDAELARDEAARTARLPSLAFRVAREALRHGPVLVQVPRRGYLPALACERCRALARCPRCAGPLALASSHAVAHCRWCGKPAGGWRCPECAWARFRAQVVGARRTAEELGRAFPSVPVRTSGRDGVLATVPGEPALVIATPGAEPVAAGGYAAALLLDGWALLGRPDLRAGEETLRRWLNAAALVRPASEGGTVVVLAEPSLAPVQALIRWDPAGYAERELADRSALGFPPAARMASVTGPRPAVDDLLASVELPEAAEVLGPVPLPGNREGTPQERALIRVPPARTRALCGALRAALAARSARKDPDSVRVQVDPLELV